MDEHAWLLVSFIIFVSLTYKRIITGLSGMIKNSELIISDKIEEAEKIYLAAKEGHEEAKNLFAQLEVTKKYIHEKEAREIEFDLAARAKDFEEATRVKEIQLENQIARDIAILKNEALHKLKDKLKSNFISYLEKDKSLAERYTNIMIDQE